MDATDIAKKLIKPLTDGVAEILAERVAEIVSTQLKQEILEAQKYRIDKEFKMKKLELEVKRQELALEEYKLNCQNKLYCEIHRVFMKQVNLDDKDSFHFQCPVDGCYRGYSDVYPQEETLRVVGQFDLS